METVAEIQQVILEEHLVNNKYKCYSWFTSRWNYLTWKKVQTRFDKTGSKKQGLLKQSPPLLTEFSPRNANLVTINNNATPKC